MRRWSVPAVISVVAVGCTTPAAMDAALDAPSDVPLEIARDVALPDRVTDDRTPPNDLLSPADVAPDGAELRDAADVPDVARMDAEAPDTDDGIRCTDPRYDDAGNALCGFCAWPDGAPIGCARCPDGGDAGKLSIC